MFVKFVMLQLVVINLLPGKIIKVYDAWNLKPVSDCTIFAGDTFCKTSPEGICEIDFTAYDSLFVSAPDYFNAWIHTLDRKEIIVYLQPVEDAPVIRISQTTDMPMALPTSVSRIDVTDIDKSRYNSIDQILKNETGISFKSYGGEGQLQNITLRGMTGEQTQVLFDGIPLNSLQLGLADFGSISSGELKEITVYKGGGAYSGSNGSIGGTIDLKPRQIPETTQLEAQQSISSLKNYTSAASAAFQLADSVDQFFNVEYKHGDNDYSVKDNGREVLLKNRDYHSLNLLWQSDFRISKLSKINILVKNLDSGGGSPNPFAGSVAESGNTARRTNNNTLARLKFNHTFSHGSISTQLYQRNEWSRYKSTLTNDLNFNKESGLQFNTHYGLTERLFFKAGLEFSQQEIISSQAGRHKKQRYAVSLLNDWNIYHDNQKPLDVFINLTNRFENNASLEAYTPGIGFLINYQSLNWFVNAVKNFRAPTFNELYWPVYGNPALKPEKSSTLESGLAFRRKLNNTFVTHIDASAVIYKSIVKDQIKWLPILRNIAEVTSSGIEISNRMYLWDDKISLNTFYTWANVRKTAAEFENDNTVGNRISYIPRHKLNIHMAYKPEPLLFGYDAEFQSYRYKSLANEDNQILPSVLIMSVWAGFTLKMPVGLSGDLLFFVENLTNQLYQLYAGYPMPPRHYKLSISINY